MRLAEIRRYPVKSLRGHRVHEARVEPWGLAGDRRWMVVDAGEGTAVTAREVNRMLLVGAEPTPTGIRLSGADQEPLEVAEPDPARQLRVQVWSSHLSAAAAGSEADAWLSQALGRPVRLVHLDDPTRRTTDPRFSREDDRVSFADGYPLLLASASSLAAVNAAHRERAGEDAPRLTMTRFRPNVVVEGAEAWAEDDWRVLRIGGAVLRAVKGCARCVMTTVDPKTGERGKEPTATLARIRRFDGATWFGVNLVPDTPDVTIRVGDEVEVLDAVEPGAGPVRPTR
ncbi:MOSC domain-containing protein [Nocardioides bruguierae]|uniref:MOSC domain-containing protein n=1 Tax=Nocardioides bruguierae TaxID=2945102 RepID=A0A9X2D4D5_9ACTN|nr:MOSC N-terminal beta barrel domain-containing protein [Nocardioides bruguierae]MCM0618829.1 MOSC domain-containing protein [Nocardioides bruguierae]